MIHFGFASLSDRMMGIGLEINEALLFPTTRGVWIVRSTEYDHTIREGFSCRLEHVGMRLWGLGH